MRSAMSLLTLAFSKSCELCGSAVSNVEAQAPCPFPLSLLVAQPYVSAPAFIYSTF